MVAVSSWFVVGKYCLYSTSHTGICVYIFFLNILWPTRFLFSLYVSFGLCLSGFRLSSVSGLGSLLLLESETRRDYDLTVGEGALHLLHLAQLSCSIFCLVSLGLSFWPGKESVLLLEGKNLLPEPALFSRLAAPHTCFCNSCVLVKTKLSFLTLFLFYPQFASFPLFKTCSKSKTSRSFSFDCLSKPPAITCFFFTEQLIL